MPRGSSSQSNGSDNDIDVLEQELYRLKKEYRVIESERKTYTKESQSIIRKQRATIASLEAQHNELNKETSLAVFNNEHSSNDKAVENVSELLKVIDVLKQHMHKAKTNLSKINQEILNAEKKINMQRKKMGGVNLSKAKYEGWQKQSKILENRLDQENKKFSSALEENAKLREAIDHMRSEKFVFDGLYKKLENKFFENKQEISKVTEDSIAAYNSRNDAQIKMLTLKEKADKDLVQYGIELKELMRIIDHDRKLRDFMNTKAEERLSNKNDEYINQVKDSKNKISDAETIIQSYNDAFKRIQTTTGIDDLQLLVGKFIATEDSNFALFNYVTEMNNEIEMKQENISEIKSNIEQLRSESEKLDKQRMNVIDEINKMIADYEKETKRTDEKFDSFYAIVENLTQGVNSLFKRANCDASAIGNLLSGQGGAPHSNIMQNLSIIEQRINELLQVHEFVSSQTEEDDQQFFQSLIGRPSIPLTSLSSIQAPAIVEGSDSDNSTQGDYDNRPLTQAELMQNIIRGTSKKGGNRKENVVNTMLSEAIENTPKSFY
ncbi:coiled-coil domain-containing protein 63 isoform X1 [Hydra vulgaris]|uniref:coiled-coil domain-containing protein 63 isoform X1 n=1 Tax=Hydra vulgaris TaxID=6087 RepID=UPI001F5EAC73|nr:coiled-coil domain-containing protein 63 [Hydra vulgaris]